MPQAKTQKVRVTSVSGTKAVPHVKQSVQVDDLEAQVGDEMELTAEQLKRLKEAGVNFGDPDNEGGDS